MLADADGDDLLRIAPLGQRHIEQRLLDKQLARAEQAASRAADASLPQERGKDRDRLALLVVWLAGVAANRRAPSTAAASSRAASAVSTLVAMTRSSSDSLVIRRRSYSTMRVVIGRRAWECGSRGRRRAARPAPRGSASACSIQRRSAPARARRRPVRSALRGHGAKGGADRRHASTARPPWPGTSSRSATRCDSADQLVVRGVVGLEDRAFDAVVGRIAKDHAFVGRIETILLFVVFAEARRLAPRVPPLGL